MCFCLCRRSVQREGAVDLGSLGDALVFMADRDLVPGGYDLAHIIPGLVPAEVRRRDRIVLDDDAVSSASIVNVECVNGDIGDLVVFDHKRLSAGQLDRCAIGKASVLPVMFFMVLPSIVTTA